MQVIFTCTRPQTGHSHGGSGPVRQALWYQGRSGLLRTTRRKVLAALSLVAGLWDTGGGGAGCPGGGAVAGQN